MENNLKPVFQPLVRRPCFCLGATKPIRSIEANQVVRLSSSPLLLRPPDRSALVMLSLSGMRLTYQINICWLCSHPVCKARSIGITQQFSTPLSAVMVLTLPMPCPITGYMIKQLAANHWQVPVFSKKFINIEGLPDEIGLDFN